MDDDELEEEWAGELASQRNLELHSIREEIDNLAERVAQKLNNLIEEGHRTSAFLIMMLIASFNDGLDILLFITGLELMWPISDIPGLFLGLVQFYFLFGKGHLLKFQAKFWRTVIFWTLGLFIEALPAIDLFPINMFMVFLAWRNVKQAADRAEKQLYSLEETTREDMEEIDRLLVDNQYAEAS